MATGNPAKPRLAIVGPCASGKTVLARRLRQMGYEVWEPAQEHSGVPDLWRRVKPDLLIFLDVSLRTLEQRGRTGWSQEDLEEQHRRLAHARAHCDYYLSTDGLSEEEVCRRVLAYLSVDR